MFVLNFYLLYRYPKVLNHLQSIVEKFNLTAIKPGNKPLDQRGDPKHWGHTWTNFGDYEENQDNNTVNRNGS